MKEKTKIIISVIITFIITISITVTASIVMDATDISFTSDKTDKTNVKDSLDELYNKVGKCPEGKLCVEVEAKISNVPIGSYISMTPTSKSYTPLSTDTGCMNDSKCTQNTINPSELNLWRVIKKNKDGSVDVVSEYVSSERIYFCGKEGYINFVGGLNTIAAQYTNEKYVQKTRHIGYSNQTERLTDTTKLSQTTVPWTSSTTKNTPDSSGMGDVEYGSDFYLVKNIIGIYYPETPLGKYNDFWLASRSYKYCGPSCTNPWWYFEGRYANVWGQDTEAALYTDGVTELCKNHAIRPILTLKSTLKIESGDGTSESPYKFR